MMSNIETTDTRKEILLKSVAFLKKMEVEAKQDYEKALAQLPEFKKSYDNKKTQVKTLKKGYDNYRKERERLEKKLEGSK